MAKILVRNKKTGDERPMTQKSFDYLSSKKRGFEFVGAIEEPKTEIQKLMDEKRAEKAAQQGEVKQAVGKSKQPANEV